MTFSQEDRVFVGMAIAVLLVLVVITGILVLNLFGT